MGVATEGRNEERDLLRIIKQMAEKRMVKYRDAQDNHTGATMQAVEEFGGLEYEEDEYEATSDNWKSASRPADDTRYGAMSSEYDEMDEMDAMYDDMEYNAGEYTAT